jgi:hypothetical protein
MPPKGSRIRRLSRKIRETNELNKASEIEVQCTLKSSSLLEQTQPLESAPDDGHGQSDAPDDSDNEATTSDRNEVLPGLDTYLKQSHLESIRSANAVVARVAALRARIMSSDMPASQTKSSDVLDAVHVRPNGREERDTSLVYDSIEFSQAKSWSMPPPLSQPPPLVAQVTVPPSVMLVRSAGQAAEASRPSFQASETLFRPSETPFRAPETPFRAPDAPFRAPDTPYSSLSGRASWTKRMEECMLVLLQQACRQGLQSDGGFKNTVYESVSAKILQTSGQTVSAKQVRSKFESMKLRYRVWNEHLASAQSGWSMNSDGIPVAAEDVMDAYFIAHPDRKWCRHSKPKWLEYLNDILGGRLASGSDAFTIDAIVSGSVTRWDDVIDPSICEGSILDSEESSSRSASIPVGSHKRHASSAHPAGRGGKMNTKEQLAMKLDQSKGEVTESISRMVEMLTSKQNAGRSHIQQAMEILNTEYTNLSPVAYGECSAILSEGNGAEVFVYARPDARAAYLNTLLRKEEIRTVIQADVAHEPAAARRGDLLENGQIVESESEHSEESSEGGQFEKSGDEHA